MEAGDALSGRFKRVIQCVIQTGDSNVVRLLLQADCVNVLACACVRVRLRVRVREGGEGVARVRGRLQLLDSPPS
jgi:hypothetical protein